MSCGALLRPSNPIFDGQGIVEEATECEVVALQDGIELMVVATGALHPGAEEDIPGRIRDVVQDILPLTADIPVVVFVNPVPEVAEGREGVGVAGKKLVARELLLDEAVVGLILVIGLDDVVTVAPGGRSEIVDAEAIAIGVADEVEPGAGHPLAVGWGRQESVDQLLVGLGVRILDEGGDLFGRGRQAGGVKAHTTNEDGAVGFA